MTTFDTLAKAIQALSPADYPHFDGQVTGSPALPWITTRVAIPGVTERSLASPGLGHTGRLIVTVAADNQMAARIVCEAAVDAWECARVSPTGWASFRLLLEGASEPYEDMDVTLATGKHPVVARLTFSFTTSRLP